MIDGKRIIVIMPAYNAEKTLEKTYNDLPKQIVDEVILVDDKSSDKTIEVAKRLSLTVFTHPKNLGYGGNQKTCYREALRRGADIVVMVHPDYQYDCTLTDELVKPITQGRFDIMLGSRIRTRKEVLAGGMPLYKYVSNRFLTFIENLVLGYNLSEYHTGFRAFTKRVLETVPFETFSNDFIFDQDIIFSAIANGLRIGEIPVPVRYFPEASSINFARSLKYGLGIITLSLSYLLFSFKVTKGNYFKK